MSYMIWIIGGILSSWIIILLVWGMCLITADLCETLHPNIKESIQKPMRYVADLIKSCFAPRMDTEEEIEHERQKIARSLKRVDELLDRRDD